MHEAPPEHVLSVKCLSDHTRNPSMNSPAISKIPGIMEDLYNMPQSSDQGEKNIIPDPLKMNKDPLLEDIAKLKATASQDSTTNSILKALTRIEEDLRNEAPARGILAKKRGIKIRGVNTGNIKEGKRVRFNLKKLAVHSKGKSYDAEPVIETGTSEPSEIKALDKVQILTTHFGKEYAEGKPVYTKGIVKTVKGQIAYVLWEDQPAKGKPWKTQITRLEKVGTILSIVCDLSGNMLWPYKTLTTIMPTSILEVGSCLSDPDPNLAKGFL